MVNSAATPPILYRGTSYHQLQLLTHPQKPLKNIERLLAEHRSAQFGGNKFPFVDDCLSALHMATEAAALDHSAAVVIAARDLNFVTEDIPCEEGTYKLSYHLDFSELKPEQLDICLEGIDLVRKLNSYNSRLSARALRGVIKDARKFSKEMWRISPCDYLPDLRDKVPDESYLLIPRN